MAETLSEFVSKVINDKQFLLEVCKNIPDELIKDDDRDPNSESVQLEQMLGEFYYAASREMGYSFDEDEFNQELRRQLGELKKFAKAKYIVRFLRTLVKAGKGKKK